MDKYRPCPSIFAMFTSDSQHPPRSRHAVYLGDYMSLITLSTKHDLTATLSLQDSICRCPIEETPFMSRVHVFEPKVTLEANRSNSSLHG